MAAIMNSYLMVFHDLAHQYLIGYPFRNEPTKLRLVQLGTDNHCIPVNLFLRVVGELFLGHSPPLYTIQRDCEAKSFLNFRHEWLSFDEDSRVSVVSIREVL